MTPERFEKIERTIEFIINSQAAFDARLQETAQLNQQQFQMLHQLIQENAQQIRDVAKVTGHQIEDISGQIKELKDACRDLLDVSCNTIARLDRLEKRDR